MFGNCSKHWLLLFVGLWLVACQPTTTTTTVEVTRQVTETITVPGDTVEVTRIVTETVMVTAVPDPPPPKDFVICGTEPDTLYPFATGMLAAEDVLNAIYEPNITNRSFGYQAHGLEKLPSLADGDAYLQTVTAQAGDAVVDVWGTAVALTEGVTVKNAAGEEVTFDGSPIDMQQLVAEFTMKPRVWSDGVPVTAADSVFAFELNRHPDTDGGAWIDELISGYEAIGELSTRWTGVPGYMDSTYFRNFWRPLPRHILGDYTPAEMYELELASRLPVGDGPFKIVEWVAGDHILLTPNDHYYRHEEGLPRLNTVTFKFLSDSNQILAQLLTGGCDYARLSSDQLPFLLDAEENSLLVTQTSSGTSYEHIDFGINSYGDYGDGNGRPDWFEDARVRQAITLCTNRQDMVDEIMYGRSEVMNSYLPSVHPLYPPDQAQWPYDPEQANALLDEVGYVDSDEDGWRDDPISGRPFQVTLITSTGSELRQQVTQIFKENMIDCGIDVQLSYVPVSELFAGGDQGGKLFGRQFDLGQFAWVSGPDPTCWLFLSEFMPGPPEEGFYGWSLPNNAGWQNAAFDTACNTADNSLPGTDTYTTAHQEAARIFAQELPIMPLFLRTKVAATRPEVMNLTLDPTQESELWNLFEIDLDLR